MINRIKKLMELKEVSVASFAELLNVNRSSFNHYFSGRSMPSLELVTKILKLYPDISSNWLILGEGEMLREANNSDNPQLNEDNQFDLFATSNYNDRDNKPFSETQKHTQDIDYEKNMNYLNPSTSDPEKDIIQENNNFTQLPQPQQDNSHGDRMVSQSHNNTPIEAAAQLSPSQAGKTIKKIVFFYKDNTFEAFLPVEH
jgi:transcriptional regulator with XRE-family HTH domain